MKKLKIVIAAILLFALLAGIGNAVPYLPPPVPQTPGSFVDNLVTVYNQSNATCVGCHPGPKAIHHALMPALTPYGCGDCHPMQGTWPNQVAYKERICVNCHNGSAFWANPTVNLKVRRPPSGRPHHNTTNAISRNCVFCHGLTTVDNYNDPNVYRPSYNTDYRWNNELYGVTPAADNKLWNPTGLSPNQISYGLPNSTSTNFSGRYWGGCLSCHQASIAIPGGPIVISNHDTHHGSVVDEQVAYNFTTGTGNLKCNFCHIITPGTTNSVGGRIKALAGEGGPLNGLTNPLNLSATNPYGRILELRNSTIQFALNDLANGTGCAQCHSVRSLHNIQPNGYQQNGEAGYGHVNNNSDCYGCHASFIPLTDERPAPGPAGLAMLGVIPGTLTTDVSAQLTIAGANFVQDPMYGTAQVLLDGAALANPTVTNTNIEVNAPGLSRGVHNIQVSLGGITTQMYQLTVVDQVTITSATLANGVITVTGTGFGTVAMQYVTIEKGADSIFSEAITTWTATNLVATSSVAAVGDKVTVSTPTGSATATITAGVTPTPTPVPGPVITSATLKNGVLTIVGTNLETKPAKNPQNNVYLVKSGKTYTASSITSWVSTKIVAKVSSNFKVGDTVTVKTVSGKFATAKIA